MTEPTPTAASAQARVQEILLLPPLPAIAHRLLELVARDDCRIEELALLIEQDPGLAARIVGMANSAYFARGTEICSVADAIVRVLGLNLVRGIAIGIALGKPLDTAACPGFQLDRYWYRAMQTATLALRLGTLSNLGKDARDCLFLSGLLHNLGQLVLVHAFPERMARVFRAWAEQPDQRLLALESGHLGMDEIEAGGIVAHRWQLPPTVGNVIAFRHDPWRAGPAAPLIQLISYCAELADRWYADPGAAAIPIAEAGAALNDADPERVDRTLQQVRTQEAQIRAMAKSLARAH